MGLPLALGSGAGDGGPFGHDFFGEISYPLYITHYPLIYMQMAWTASHPEAPQWQHIMMSVSVFFIAIFIAWAVLKLFDEPVRKWLTEHWLKRK